MSMLYFELPPGHTPIRDQAQARGVDPETLVGKTVGELKALGYVFVMGDILDEDVFKAHPDSPTGYAVVYKFREQVAMWSLAS